MELFEGTMGPGVAALHEQLRALGHEVLTPERERALFGASTRQAVAGFQRAQGLATSGAVDRGTRDALDEELAFARWEARAPLDKAAVRMLHDDLAVLALPVGERERERAVYGASTAAMVRRHQRGRALVDDEGAAEIAEAAHDRLRWERGLRRWLNVATWLSAVVLGPLWIFLLAAHGLSQWWLLVLTTPGLGGALIARAHRRTSRHVVCTSRHAVYAPPHPIGPLLLAVASPVLALVSMAFFVIAFAGWHWC